MSLKKRNNYSRGASQGMQAGSERTADLIGNAVISEGREHVFFQREAQANQNEIRPAQHCKVRNNCTYYVNWQPPGCFLPS